MSLISFQKLLSIIEYVLKILLKAVDVLQGDDEDPTPYEQFVNKDK